MYLPDNHWMRLGVLLGTLLFCSVLVLLLLSHRNHWRSKAWFRLDWYLPVLRKSKPGRHDTAGWLYRIAQRLLPASAFSERATKRRGKVRRLLRAAGISFQASPIRRITQALCLFLFLGLFSYTCWPYDTRPQPEGWRSPGWRFSSLDQQSGSISLSGQSDWAPIETSLGQPVALVVPAEAGSLQRESYLLKMASVSAANGAEVDALAVHRNTVTLEPLDALHDRLLERLLTESTLAWEIHQYDPTAWPSHYTDNLSRKEILPAELFLAIDPLVSLSTAIASRSWVWSLTCAAVMLAVCIVIPRGFCGYLCPLGTTIDLFDWAIGRRVTRFRVPSEGWWVHIKYYLLAACLVSAMMGVLITGVFSAIPIITRACLMIMDPLQTGAVRGWHLIPAMNLGHFVSLALFLGVLALGFLQPRFWCKYVCPSGATFSIFNVFRATQRQVESSCINCNKCVQVCPFDAIKPDFTTRVSDCTLCQTCAGVCPTHAIKFVERGNRVELKVLNDPPTGETALGRRGFLSLAAGSAAAVTGGIAVAGVTKALGAGLSSHANPLPIRPPGSVPEQDFLEMCIRCGECFKVCPNNVLQVQGFEQGLEGLWTPVAKPDWAGCESSCNACGQVCPTGAIRALPLEEKRVARMGLAVVNEATCLPHAGQEDCDLCVVECQAAGYHAIEYQQVATQVDDAGQPIEGTGFLAPVVLDDKCVGCGLCQTRCYGINVKQKHLLSGSAIIVEVGDGKEDRIMQGSYIQLAEDRKQAASPISTAPESVLEPNPSVVPPPTQEDLDEDFGDNPFGLQ